jgi:hypothetical protein
MITKRDIFGRSMLGSRPANPLFARPRRPFTWRHEHGGSTDMVKQNTMAADLGVSRDEVGVSVNNLVKANFAGRAWHEPIYGPIEFGRHICDWIDTFRARNFSVSSMELRVSAEYAGRATVKTLAKRTAKVIGCCLTWFMTAHHGSCSNKIKEMMVPAGPGRPGDRLRGTCYLYGRLSRCKSISKRSA